MEIIKRSSDGFQTIIGLQIYKRGFEYVKSPYIRAVQCDDGVLIYNSLTGEIILTTDSQFNNPTPSEKRWFIEHWFYIEEKNDPKTIADMIRQALTHRSTYSSEVKKPNGYVIMTTTYCNARCFYCYEAGYHQKPMSDKVALDVAKYIIKNNPGGVNLTWFGGEPLCNQNCIRVIVEHLRKNGIPYKTSMITNGYLITEDIIQKMKNEWNLNHLQITLDGTKDVYNKTKNYRNEDPNAFEHVLDNIELLLKNDIQVNVRMNIGLHNGDDILNLIKILKERFNRYKNFSAYATELFIGEGDPPLELTDEQAIQLYENTKRASELLQETGLGYHRFGIDIDHYQACHCMADSCGSRLITIEGNISPCEHYAYNEIIGSIYDGKNNNDILEKWKERVYKEECATCYNYPKCYKIKKCPSDSVCEKPQRIIMDYHIDSIVMMEYKQFLQKNKKRL